MEGWIKSGWVDEKWMGVWMDEWMGKWVYGWMSGWVNGWWIRRLIVAMTQVIYWAYQFIDLFVDMSYEEEACVRSCSLH